MTYQAYEESKRLGSPIELFEITIGNTNYRYTNNAKDITIGLDVYKANIIKRGSVTSSAAKEKSDLSLTIVKDDPLAAYFATQSPSIVIPLTVYRSHENDPDNEVVVTWTGRVIDTAFKKDYLEIKAESVLTSINRQGLTRTFSTNCAHTLYDANCRLLRGDWVVPVGILGVNARTITVSGASGLGTNYFRGGYIEASIGNGILERRGIVASNDTTITVSYNFSDLSNTFNATAYPGCSHNFTTCRDKFSNELNYGGFPYTPVENPFETTIY